MTSYEVVYLLIKYGVHFGTHCLHQLYNDDVPLGHISAAELRELVVRPERPDSDENP
jgi:hypothetical protein